MILKNGDGEFKVVHGSEDVSINYLLSWENKEDDNYYIIQIVKI
jgi:hypothetical protein